jgi:hypothetical protein
MNTPEDANEIRRHMRQIREDLRNDVGILVDQMHNYSDWRYYWHKYPWVCLGTAAALGFAIVPRRTIVKMADPRVLLEMVKQRGMIVEEGTASRGNPGVTGVVFSMLGRAIAQGAMNYMQKNGPRILNDLWTNNTRSS